jgi:hypothetical protein
MATAVQQPTQDPWAVVSQGPPPATAVPAATPTPEQGDQWAVVSQKPAPATIGPAPKASDANISLPESVAGPAPVQALTMPLIKGLMAAHDKLKEVSNMTEEGKQGHPILGHVGELMNKIEGLLTGTSHGEAAIGSGKFGMLTNPVTAAIIPGAEGTPALAEGLEQGASLAKTAYQTGKQALQTGKDVVTGGKAAEETPGLVKQVLQGKGVAQEPAKAAVREAVGADEDAPLLSGNKTVVDDQLNDIAGKRTAAYAKIDKEAGFDVKEAMIRLRNDKYKLQQLGNTEADQNQREKLTASIQDASGRIADANKKIADAGINPEEASDLHKKWSAGQEFKKVLVRSLNTNGDVDVDKMLTGIKGLRTLSKYGDRIEQFFGKEGADGLTKDLEEAKKAGQTALSRQKLAKNIAKYAVPAAVTAGGAAAATYEALK